MKGASTLRITALVGLSTVGVAGFLYLSLDAIATRVDAASRVREETVVANGVQRAMKDAELIIEPQVMWDDAVLNLDRRYDAEWATTNIGQYLSTIGHFSDILVLDGRQRTRLAFHEGEPAKPDKLDWLKDVSAPLVAQVRVAESARGAFAGPSRDGKMIASRIAATAIAKSHGVAMIVTAILVQPDFGTTLPRTAAPVVVTALPLDETFLDGFGARFMLEDLALGDQTGPKHADHAEMPLRAINGATVAHLHWSPQTPGAAMARDVFPPLLSLLAAIAGIAAIFWRRHRAVAAELRRSERQTALAQAADKAKGDFLAKMSHELRTPLNAIIGYSELMSEQAVDEGRIDATTDHDRVLSAARHLLRLVDDLLDLAKIEAGSLKAIVSEIPMDVFLREVMEACEYGARRNGNTLVLTAPPSWPTVATDGAKLKQCLFNLLSNACKFTHDGRVELQVSTIDEGRRLRFAVIDDGIGMTAEQMERVFNPFVQAEADTHHSFGGTGLGLSVSRELAHLLGGDIAVTSAPGQGTTFTLEIETRLDEREAAAEYEEAA
jgi:signal transduction histidine kinase